ncbi:UNVERIFIED_CONTAM: zinc finger protein, putative [Hammondia hammondi]|eukprot:XP_008888643.1 zinc finger protein, putative [Hammondia hammondi]
MVSIDECRLRRSGGTGADAATASPAPCWTQRASAGSASGSKKMSRDAGARAEQSKSSQSLTSKAEKAAPVNAWIMAQYSAATTKATRVSNGRTASGTEGGSPTGSPSTAGNGVTRNQAKNLAGGGDKGRSVSEEGKDMETPTQGPGSGKSWGRGARPPEESKRRATTSCRSAQVREKSRLPAEELPPLVLKVAREQVVGDLCSASLLCSACGLLLLSPLVHPRCGHMLCRDCLVILSATHFHSVHRINFKNVSPVERRHDSAASPSLAHVTSALLHMFPSPASLPLSAQSPSAPSFCPRCTYGEAVPVTNFKEASRPPGASAAAALRVNGASSGSGSGGCSSQLLPGHAHLPRMLKPQQTCPLGEFLSAVATEKGVPALLGRVLSKVRVRCSAGKTTQVSGADARAAQAGESREVKVGVDAWGRPREIDVQKPSDPGFGNGSDGSTRERASVATLRDALCSKHRVATPSEGGCKWDGDYAGYLEHIKRPGECGRLYWGETNVQTEEPRVAEGGKPPKSSRNGDIRFRD